MKQNHHEHPRLMNTKLKDVRVALNQKLVGAGTGNHDQLCKFSVVIAVLKVRLKIQRGREMDSGWQTITLGGGTGSLIRSTMTGLICIASAESKSFCGSPNCRGDTTAGSVFSYFCSK